MSRLADAHRSVNAGSSPADDYDQTADDALPTEPQSAGHADDSGAQPEGTGGRTVDNVRGELLRKNELLASELQALREELRSLRDVPAPQPAQPKQPTLDDMSISELEAARNQIPEEQLPAFDRYLNERRVDDKVQQGIQKYAQSAEFKRTEQKANETAYERWPQLRQQNSQFYKLADRILSDMGARADNDPEAVLVAANEAGLRLGLRPADVPTGGGGRNGRQPVPGRTNSPTNSKDDATGGFDEKLAARLADAMPGQKFTEEQKKRIAERDAIYRQNINTYVKG